ncbi:MAG: LysR family transcriptional regulator [Deltaproteobacteria bacterium]|nr:LysR family transcriptional regulator [Deltaproteobacteria bacterium]
MRFPRIHLDQLLTFRVVATERSFTAAADMLSISQPAVTMQIRALEETYGIKLIHVKKKKVHLTAEGERLLSHAEEIYRAALRAEDLLTQHGRARTLRIGLAGALAVYVSPVINVFGELYPSVRVVVREGLSLKLLEELRDFQHDLCFVAALEEPAKDLEAFPLRHPEPMMLVAARTSPLVERAEVTWSDLDGCPLILHGEGSVARKLILEEFQRRGLTPNISAEVDNIAYLKQLIERRGGVALMFSPNVEEEVAQHKLEVLNWKGGDLRLGIDVVVRREEEPSPARSAFLGVMKKHFGGNFDYGP